MAHALIMNELHLRADYMLETEMDACMSDGESSRLARSLLNEGLTDTTLFRLSLLVRKRLSSADFGRVDVVLKSLEILLDDKDVACNLFALAITYQVLSWFQTVRDRLLSADQRSSAQTPLMDSFYDILLLLSRSRPPGGSGSDLDVILLELLHTFLEGRLHYGVRLEATRTFNSILDSLSREGKKHVQSKKELQEKMLEVAATIRTIGDYELQASLLEALCRLTPRKERMARAGVWFSRSDLAEAFCLIKDGDFELDCRRFLNFLNDRRDDRERVWTLPCVRAFLETTELCRPKDEKLDEFWVDFNLGSRSVTFFVDMPEGFLWGSVHLLMEEVERYRLEVRQEEGGGSWAVLGVRMKVPVTHLGVKGHRVELLFRPQLLQELRAAAGGVFPQEVAERDPAEGAPPSETRTLGRCGRKRPRVQLKVLPLSSPCTSDEDAKVLKISRSSAEVLFQQVIHSTPLKDSGVLFEEEPAIFQGDALNLSPITMDKFASGDKTDSGYLSNQCDDPGSESTAAGQIDAGIHRPAVADRRLDFDREPPMASAEGDAGPPSVVAPVAVADKEGEEEEVEEEEEEEPAGSSGPTGPTPLSDTAPGITDALEALKRSLEQHFHARRQKVRAQVSSSPREFQRHVDSLFDDIRRHRATLLEDFETSLWNLVKCLEETSAYLDNMYSQMTNFFQSEKRRLSDFCEEHQQRLRSGESPSLGRSLRPADPE
ncbi:synaptonemal complex protein 2-like isoform X2 [Stigmatopora argus]